MPIEPKKLDKNGNVVYTPESSQSTGSSNDTGKDVAVVVVLAFVVFLIFATDEDTKLKAASLGICGIGVCWMGYILYHSIKNRRPVPLFNLLSAACFTGYGILFYCFILDVFASKGTPQSNHCFAGMLVAVFLSITFAGLGIASKSKGK